MSIQRVWKSGKDTLVVTVKKDVRDFYNINEGDFVDVQIAKVEKKEKTKVVDEPVQNAPDAENKNVFKKEVNDVQKTDEKPVSNEEKRFKVL